MRTRLLILLCACAAVPLTPAAAQSTWALTGRLGLSKEFGQMDGPALGAVGGDVAVLRYVGAKTALGIELAWYDFGSQATVGLCANPTCTEYDYQNYVNTVSTGLALTLRVQERSKPGRGFFVTTLGLYRYAAGEGGYQSWDPATGLGASVGGGITAFRLGSHALLSVEGRLHGAAGATSDSFGTWSWVTLGASVLVH